MPTSCRSDPTILKLNSSNSLARGADAPSQAITGSVAEAVRLGCSAVGFTIYPGSDAAFEMMGQFQEIAAEAKALGLAVVLWSYPRGGGLSKPGETALDVAAYAAHMAALLGAHIIKVKPPTDHLEQDAAKAVYESTGVARAALAERVSHIMQASFAGRRIVIFSGGAAKDRDGLLEEIRGLRDGGPTAPSLAATRSSARVKKPRASFRNYRDLQGSASILDWASRYQSVSAHSGQGQACAADHPQ